MKKFELKVTLKGRILYHAILSPTRDKIEKVLKERLEIMRESKSDRDDLVEALKIHLPIEMGEDWYEGNFPDDTIEVVFEEYETIREFVVHYPEVVYLCMLDDEVYREMIMQFDQGGEYGGFLTGFCDCDGIEYKKRPVPDWEVCIIHE